jgi:hypothetical protein
MCGCEFATLHLLVITKYWYGSVTDQTYPDLSFSLEMRQDVTGRCDEIVQLHLVLIIPRF